MLEMSQCADCFCRARSVFVQVMSAREQDRLYQRCIRQTLAGLGPSQRSISSLVEPSQEEEEERDELEEDQVEVG